MIGVEIEYIPNRDDHSNDYAGVFGITGAQHDIPQQVAASSSIASPVKTFASQTPMADDTIVNLKGLFECLP